MNPEDETTCPACHGEEPCSHGFDKIKWPDNTNPNPPAQMEAKELTRHWPCPNNCMNWCRDDIRVKDGAIHPMTNHHPRCEHVNDSLMDVWRVSLDGSSYVTHEEPCDLGDGLKVTPEKMHREIYEHLPEFDGF